MDPCKVKFMEDSVFIRFGRKYTHAWSLLYMLVFVHESEKLLSFIFAYIHSFIHLFYTHISSMVIGISVMEMRKVTSNVLAADCFMGVSHTNS